MGESSGRCFQGCGKITLIINMMNKIFRLYILFAVFLLQRVFLLLLMSPALLSTTNLPWTGRQRQASQVPAVPADAAAADTHTSYLYDLKKLIEKSRENIKEVNEKIKEQAVLKRNQKREERAREYYEKGVELTNEGKLDEAREYFEKAIRITEHPEMAGYIKESQRRLKKTGKALQPRKGSITIRSKRMRIPAKKMLRRLIEKRLICISRKNIIRPKMPLNMLMRLPLITGPPAVI